MKTKIRLLIKGELEGVVDIPPGIGIASYQNSASRRIYLQIATLFVHLFSSAKPACF